MTPNMVNAVATFERIKCRIAFDLHKTHIAWGHWPNTTPSKGALPCSTPPWPPTHTHTGLAGCAMSLTNHQEGGNGAATAATSIASYSLTLKKGLSRSCSSPHTKSLSRPNRRNCHNQLGPPQPPQMPWLQQHHSSNSTEQATPATTAPMAKGQAICATSAGAPANLGGAQVCNKSTSPNDLIAQRG